MSTSSDHSNVRQPTIHETKPAWSTTPPISPNILETLDPCVVLMKQLISKYSNKWPIESTGGIFSLAQGVVYWDPPTTSHNAILEALGSNEGEGQRGYSLLHTYGPDEGLPELRAAVLQKLARENNLHNHNVMITSGANQAYMNCILTLLDTKSSSSSKAVVFAPYYFNHVMALQMTMNNPKSNLLVGPIDPHTGQPNLHWLHEQFRRYNKNTLYAEPLGSKEDAVNGAANGAHQSEIRIVTIVNPGNPTGVYLPRDYVQKVVDLCRTYNCWLIIDATYEYFVHATTAIDEFDAEVETLDSSTENGCFFGLDRHVIHISSFSKSYSLAGYRCGYVVVHNDATVSRTVSPLDKSSLAGTTTIFDQMMKVQDTIPICPSRISQIACLGAMQSGRPWVRKQIQSLQPSRAAVLDALSPLTLCKRDSPHHLNSSNQTSAAVRSDYSHNSTNDSNDGKNCNSCNNETIIMGGSGAMYFMGKLPPPALHSTYRREQDKVNLQLLQNMDVNCNSVYKDWNVYDHEDSDTTMDDVMVATMLVRDYGVAVIPGSFCGYPGWIRVCYSNLPPNKCLHAAKRLKDGLSFLVDSHT